MLTEAEKNWLEERKPPTVKPWPTTADDNFCKHCKQRITDCVPWYRNTGDCPTDRGGDYRDAAEFEARVALKCARLTFGELPCGAGDCADERMFSLHGGCDGCVIRAARLSVEKEMEAESARH